ncbi:MAG: chorismate-binding protein [Caulobacteraceae bacterium]|nr:chorismate-binding protein [Caulobacteraceae bacterium]
MRCVALIETPQGRWREPAEILAAFAEEPWALGLLSGGGGRGARWSYLARRPDRTLVCKPSDADDPFEALRALLGPPQAPHPDGPPFQGGVAGLCAYELGAWVERLALQRLEDWPDLACARYPALLAFDHRARRVLAIGCGETQDEAEDLARVTLGWLEEAGAKPAPSRSDALAAQLQASSAAAYEAAVAEVVKRIGLGEIFQANVARAWRGRLTTGARPIEVLLRLVRSSPAPFAAYLRLPGKAVVSNSPERFIGLQGLDGRRLAETRPIKGTRPRGPDPVMDAAEAHALAASAKDRAENLMIVDLMRNDLARVCRPGSVRAPELFALESFANVHHLVSTVTGELLEGLGPVELLRASLPAGSITGAPKVQAMKVIAGLEPPRGPFFGTMFWAGADGAMDSSVLIRTLAFAEDDDGWRFEARAGAGLVADSEPQAERCETEAKIAAILAALAPSVGFAATSPAPRAGEEKILLPCEAGELSATPTEGASSGEK